MNRSRFGDIARRARDVSMTMIQRPLWSYILTPIVNDDGVAVAYSAFAYIVQCILAVFSEVLVRIVITFVAVLALSGVNGGTINFTLAALAKGLVVGAMIMMMGRISAYSRFGNVWASWFPSSRRMFSTDSVQPYADLIHCIAYSIFQYGGSLVGCALVLWVSNFNNLNQGLPSTTADTFGLLGNYPITTSDIWLIEICGSALITFAWLMAVVHQRGVKHHVYAGLVVGFVTFVVSAVTISATGANFDFLHYAAMRTILANANVVNNSHTAAYLVAPIIGACIAWVGYLIVAWLSFAIDYSKPGIPGYMPSYDPLLSASAHLTTTTIKPNNVTVPASAPIPSSQHSSHQQHSAPRFVHPQHNKGARGH